MSNATGLKWLYKEHLNYGNVPAGGDEAAYSKALLVCAKGDGVISENERAWMVGYAAAFGADEAHLEMLKAYDGGDDIVALVAANPGLKAQSRDVVYDAIRVSYADGDMSDGERQAIAYMAQQLGLAAELVGQLEAVYLAEQSLKQARWALTYPQGAPL